MLSDQSLDQLHETDWTLLVEVGSFVYVNRENMGFVKMWVGVAVDEMTSQEA